MEKELPQSTSVSSPETLVVVSTDDRQPANGENTPHPEHARSSHRQTLGVYFREAIRALGFLAPNWQSLPRVSPLWSVLLIVSSVLFEVAFSRFEVDGAAQFYPASLLSGWLSILVFAWCVWWVASALDDTHSPEQAKHVDAGSVFLLGMAMQLIVNLLTMFFHVFYDQDALSGRGYVEWAIAWVIWLVPVVWITLAIVFVLFRVSVGRRDLRSPLPAVGLLIIAVVVSAMWNRSSYWYPDYENTTTSETKAENRFRHLTPEALKKQSILLDEQLGALAPQRPGVVDVYAITYAPYSSENVFLNESKIVLQVMRDRFGANNRTVQLVNHNSTIATQPWATPENLSATLKRVAALADPTEDVVFLHLTSHGSKGAALETSFWPIQIETLDALKLRGLLDDANVASRVISVSACYSGTWLPFHQTPNTLIMTASDAEHTSYGCGYKSEITYFTRAMFDEQLRNNTRSFEDALKAARPIIDAREKEAGKSDGFSNPQIYVGDGIRGKLDTWARELERSP
jgi:Peptidase C13 family